MKLRKLIKNTLAIALTVAATLTATCQTAFAATEKSFSATTMANELEAGFYDNISINAENVYKKGVEAGKANADVITTVNDIVVDPGAHGKFAEDGSTKPKKFNDTNMDDFTLNIIATSGNYSLSGWNITINNGNLTYIANWGGKTMTYTSNTTVNVDTTGVYRLQVHGGNSDTNPGKGAYLAANFHLEAGGSLQFNVNSNRYEGGGGFTAVYYKKPGGSAYYPLLVAGGASNGLTIGGNVDGCGNSFDRYLENGSGRVTNGKDSTSLDQSSAYNASAMNPSGWGPSQGAKMTRDFWSSEEIFGGGAGWRGGNNGLKKHWEGDYGLGYHGINTVWNYSTAGSSHYITSSEANSWGLTDAYSLISVDGGALNKGNANVTFTGGGSTGAKAIMNLVSED